MFFAKILLEFYALDSPFFFPMHSISCERNRLSDNADVHSFCFKKNIPLPWGPRVFFAAFECNVCSAQCTAALGHVGIVKKQGLSPHHTRKFWSYGGRTSSGKNTISTKDHKGFFVKPGVL